MLDKLNDLIELIKEDPRIIRYQELEAIIDRNQELNNMYQELIELQKQMVQANHYNNKDYQIKKQKYQEQLSKINQFPLIEEFLTLQNDINEEIILIVNMIESEINKDFDY